MGGECVQRVMAAHMLEHWEWALVTKLTAEVKRIYLRVRFPQTPCDDVRHPASIRSLCRSQPWLAGGMIHTHGDHVCDLVPKSHPRPDVPTQRFTLLAITLSRSVPLNCCQALFTCIRKADLFVIRRC